MSLLQLYSATSGESSGDPSPCPSPIPVVPSLTTNFPLLPTSPLRYPHPLQPVFFRMATPPNTQPQRPKNHNVNIRIPAAHQHHQHHQHRAAFNESPESDGDEDREAMLRLQVLHPSPNPRCVHGFFFWLFLGFFFFFLSPQFLLALCAFKRLQIPLFTALFPTAISRYKII